MKKSKGYQTVIKWLASEGLKPFDFQEETWSQIIKGYSGIVNAPTGFGKTYSIFLGSIITFINQKGADYSTSKNNGLQLLWVTPLRALAKDLSRAMEEVVSKLELQWKVGVRNGDTTLSERQKQKRHVPEILIITPESLHLLLSQKHHEDIFGSLKIVAVDEWHELIGSKRGVQVELALSRLAAINARTSRLGAMNTGLLIWGISATIGNLDQALEVLLAPGAIVGTKKHCLITARLDKKIAIESIIPDEIEKYPWAGHLGIKLAEKVLPIIEQSRTTLIFINTRGMSEMWYQRLLSIAPELAGALALHHGSIDQELRVWVEEALHEARLKAVVCTASLDLGVDFRPVDTVIQVGSPKGVARFLQRAGRSGHQPGETSKVFFLPTHSLELVEIAAIKKAIDSGLIESRDPLTLCFDVLAQYLCTLAVGDGFRPGDIYKEIRETYCFRDINDHEWQEVLYHISSGGNALQSYDEYKKIVIEDGIYKIVNRRIAMRHRMHIGTIVSDAMLKVKMLSGGFIGMVEESFASRLSPGDIFTIAGRTLELVAIKDMEVIARKSSSTKSNIPSWMGGRIPLSSSLGHMLRVTLDEAFNVQEEEIEKGVLQPLLLLQEQLSHVPKVNELLVELIYTKDGYHLFVYPFEGRLVHEAMAALLAYRLSRRTAISFSIAMNDYGFELLADIPIPLEENNVYQLFSPEALLEDIQKSVNSVEMAKRKFRDIAVIGGLIFQGYPGEHKKARHLQNSASLLFKVLSEYDNNNILVRQAYQEVFTQQMEEVRLRQALERIQNSNITITYPPRLTPFCFPIKVDSMREHLTSEKLQDRIKKIQQQLSKGL